MPCDNYECSPNAADLLKEHHDKIEDILHRLIQEIGRPTGFAKEYEDEKERYRVAQFKIGIRPLVEPQ